MADPRFFRITGPYMLGELASIANATLLEKLPKPLITMDQLRLLKYDNVLTGENKSNFNLGIKSKLKFEDEVKKYAYMWKKGGQYSK